MTEKMQIEVGADVKGAVTGLQKVNTEMRKLPKVSSEAAQSLNNLSRVAQDAPYGFIGIANNLNPLIESFGRLRAETGNNKTALKALASSLMGVGGIGLAVGLASSLMVVFGDKLFGAGKKAKEAAEGVKEAAKSVRELASDIAASDVSKIQTIAAALTDLNIPLKSRTKAMEEYNKVADEQNRISKDDLDNIGKINAAVNSQIELYQRRALVRAAEEKLKGLYKTIFDEEDKLRKAIEGSGKQTAGDVVRNVTDAQKKALPVLKATNNAAGQAVSGLTDAQRQSLPVMKMVTGAGKRVVGSLKTMEEAVGLVGEEFVNAEQKIGLSARGFKNNISNAKKEIAGLFQFIRQQSLEGDLFGSVFQGDKEKSDKSKQFDFLFDFLPFNPNGSLKPEQKAQLLTAIDKFSKEFNGIFEGVDFRLIAKSEDGAIETARQWWANYKRGIVKFAKGDVFGKALDAQTLEVPLSIVPKAEIDPKDAESLRKQYIDGLGRALNKEGQPPIVITPELQADFDDFKKKLDNEKKVRAAIQDNVNDAAKGISVAGFVSVGEAIAAAITGGNVGTIFQQLGQTIGAVVQQLGAQMIALSPVIQALKVAITALKPAGILAAGIGLVALGGIIKGATKVKGFAAGGLVYGPTMGLVGEGIGTSKSNPEVIAPLDKLKNIIGGGGSFPDYLPAWELRGDTLRAWYAKAEKKGGQFI
jgi:hypothetical protein